MPFNPRWIAIVAANGAIAFCVTSCGLSKIVLGNTVHECNQIIDVINEGVARTSEIKEERQKFLSGEKPEDAAAAIELVNKATGAMETLVPVLDNFGQELEDLEVKDEQLVELRNRYITNLQEFSQGMNKGKNGLREMEQLLAASQDVKPDQISPEETEKLREDLETAEDKIKTANRTFQSAGQEIDKIAAEINAYCDRKLPESTN